MLLGASFLITIVLSVIIIPILRKLKVGQIERTDGPTSHLQKQGTPTMGGIIIAITLIIMGVFVALKVNDIIPLVVVSLGFGLVGAIDDRTKLIYQNTKGISPTAKMLGLLIISVMYVLFLTNNDGIGTQTLIPILNIYRVADTCIYAFCNMCNAWDNKCNKLDRWNRRIIFKCFYDNNIMFNSYRNT